MDIFGAERERILEDFNTIHELTSSLDTLDKISRMELKINNYVEERKGILLVFYIRPEARLKVAEGRRDRWMDEQTDGWTDGHSLL